jgi:predicted 2-oxoglutarate/Fe(II)-dependent dioxygenase YbiX
MIIQLEHAVSDDDCRRLTAMYDCRAALTNARDHNGQPVVYWDQMRELPAAVEIVSPLVENCLCTLGELLPAAGPLYPETVILAALDVGGYHSAHADNCRQNEQGDWVANHTPQRDVSAIYYLNDTFEGGEIVFERVPLVVKPRRGLLLAFPSDAAHLHEVLPVRTGIRYTMPIWFTKQQRFALVDFSIGATPIGAEVRTPR